MIDKKENEMKNERGLHFKVSSGLKSIIGKDLITNDFVAIFELVKNSFDAGGTRVDVCFEEDQIWIIDNGKGMTYDDIVNKWLFVAYSAKKDGSEDSENADYRSRIKSRRAYAGSKGVGRFSCDRLGMSLELQARSKSGGSAINVLDVDWGKFEVDDKHEFANIEVNHRVEDDFELPKSFLGTGKIRGVEHGVVLKISLLRDVWSRNKILELKAALSKLINPFGKVYDEFEVYIRAPRELEEDKVERQKRENDEESSYKHVVNGKVENFIFKTLEPKTTRISVHISDDGEKIVTKLVDRSEVIYEVSEGNPYLKLVGSDFSCNIYYLNQAAKSIFTRRMGVRSVSFGSVFLFRNGFRVFPVGEEEDDSFGLDHRKQQGFSRFLGTRDIVGRIDVAGSDEDFRESTSRDQGLIETVAYEQLKDCFWEKCLKRLENYVVGVNWKDKLDKEHEDASRLGGDKARSRVINVVSKLVNSEEIELISYNSDLIGILNEKSEDFEGSLNDLKAVAQSTHDKNLFDRIEKAELRFKELKEAERLAREQAELERKAREEAEAAAEEAVQAKAAAEEDAKSAEVAYEEEKKRNLFLASVTSLDYDNIVNLHHQIGIYSADVHHVIANQIDKIIHGEKIDDEYLMTIFEQLSLKNQKILSVSKFATKANFRLDSGMIEEDLANFIRQYIEEICSFHKETGYKIYVDVEEGSELVRSFKPIEISIVIDNLINNAEKAGATDIKFNVNVESSKILNMTISDNGLGIDPSIKEPDRIFEKGVSTTSGSGLGLYHVSYILDQMGGGIRLIKSDMDGTQFLIRINE